MLYKKYVESFYALYISMLLAYFILEIFDLENFFELQAKALRRDRVQDTRVEIFKNIVYTALKISHFHRLYQEYSHPHQCKKKNIPTPPTSYFYENLQMFLRNYYILHSYFYIS